MFSFWKSKPSLITLAKEGNLAGVRDRIAKGKDLNKQDEVKYFPSFSPPPTKNRHPSDHYNCLLPPNHHDCYMWGCVGILGWKYGANIGLL